MLLILLLLEKLIIRIVMIQKLVLIWLNLWTKLLVCNLLIQFNVLSVWYEFVCIVTRIVIRCNRPHLVLTHSSISIAFNKLIIILSILALIWLIVMWFKVTVDELISFAGTAIRTFTWVTPLMFRILLILLKLIMCFLFSRMIMFRRIWHISYFNVTFLSMHF